MDMKLAKLTAVTILLVLVTTSGCRAQAKVVAEKQWTVENSGKIDGLTTKVEVEIWRGR